MDYTDLGVAGIFILLVLRELIRFLNNKKNNPGKDMFYEILRALGRIEEKLDRNWGEIHRAIGRDKG